MIDLDSDPFGDIGFDTADPGPTEPPSSKAKKPPPSNDILTEDSAALEFARLYADRLRYCHSIGAWFQWDGFAWRQNVTKLARHWARELARRLSQDEPAKTRYVANKAGFAIAVESLAQGDPTLAVTSEAWDGDPWLLGTPGGIVDLQTGRLHDPRPEDGITKLTAIAPTPSIDCPQWLAFLDQATGGDKELIRFLQQWAGYCLTGLTREHALVFVYGPGGNGKSVFLNVLTGILAAYATTAAMDTFTASKGDKHPTDLAMLRGARLVTASETEEDRAWAEARIKQMTGGDPITARFMRQDFFTFVPNFKLTIVGNHQPMLRNVDDAARRRFNIVPFTRKPARPDRQLEVKLQAEWPGILRWMIAGCLDWQANGLVRPSSVVSATEAYFVEQDLFGQWIADECKIEPAAWSPSADLFESWSKYARAAADEPGRGKAFGAAMRRKGFADKRVQGMRGWAGIRVKSEGQNYNSYARQSRGE